MNNTNPKPDNQFLETAVLLKQLLEKGEAAARPQERKRLETILKRKFIDAFGFSPDRRSLAKNLYYRFINTEFAPGDHLFDHVEYFQRRANLIIVSQPYVDNEIELGRWAAEFGASYTIANEWGYYYPGHAFLFFAEFSPIAKANLDRSVHAARQ